ncbi:hypothetical protein LEP1GSC036_0447 [Leptospira weilii str. 2006001853]|uniref:Uncharacterized protein n=2 Tax=Leptospira weilii TaxID=28184 RepID=A0A828Z608_9LEPT|nr:hypothetical protein LEP1GSC036_0447 [Leptospira weilii str. 2006001853]EMJ59962.1 hypothetical protein LEP1GSC051_1920 [Leptospira sp. P2653]EMN44803.1 hypothetical protein LEP1GSC086_0699 [Leptospira weilii str. LNT 1234]EMY13549.1 hypothetical protein LEP1GSC043_4402 [Leptospira weilii str. Ecochallenge]
MRILLYYFSIISGHTIDSGFTSGEPNTILHTHSLDWSVFALFSGIQEFIRASITPCSVRKDKIQSSFFAFFTSPTLTVSLLKNTIFRRNIIHTN